MRSRRPKKTPVVVRRRRPRMAMPPAAAPAMPMRPGMPPGAMVPPGAGPPMPSMKKGGVVKKTGPHKLHKGEKVVPKKK
jgi:hypothetical protein